jgi:hypothetical protein
MFSFLHTCVGASLIYRLRIDRSEKWHLIGANSQPVGKLRNVILNFFLKKNTINLVTVFGKPSPSKR